MARWAGNDIFGCIGAVGFEACEGFGCCGINSEDHAGLTMFSLAAVEPFWCSAVNCDCEGGDCRRVGIVRNRHETGERALLRCSRRCL